MLVFGDGRRFFVFRRPVVEMRRIELLTPLLARQVLSQLSYTPK